MWAWGLSLGFSHIVILQRFLCDHLAVFGQFFERATDHLNILRQLILCFYQLQVEYRFFADLLSAPQVIEDSVSKPAIASQKKFTKSLKAIAGLNIQFNVK